MDNTIIIHVSNSRGFKRRFLRRGIVSDGRGGRLWGFVSAVWQFCRKSKRGEGIALCLHARARRYPGSPEYRRESRPYARTREALPLTRRTETVRQLMPTRTRVRRCMVLPFWKRLYLVVPTRPRARRCLYRAKEF